MSAQPVNKEPQEVYLSAQEAQKFLGIKKGLFFKRVREGRIPFQRDTIKNQNVYPLSKLQTLKINRIQ